MAIRTEHRHLLFSEIKNGAFLLVFRIEGNIWCCMGSDNYLRCTHRFSIKPLRYNEESLNSNYSVMVRAMIYLLETTNKSFSQTLIFSLWNMCCDFICFRDNCYFDLCILPHRCTAKLVTLICIEEILHNGICYLCTDRKHIQT